LLSNIVTLDKHVRLKSDAWLAWSFSKYFTFTCTHIQHWAQVWLTYHCKKLYYVKESFEGLLILTGISETVLHTLCTYRNLDPR
jgi:hypothetical protein